MKIGIKRTIMFLCALFVLVAAGFALSTGKTLTKAEELDATFEMVNGASVRFADNDDSGIRFRVKMGESIYNEIVDNGNVTLQFIITSKTEFDNANGNYKDISNKRVIDVDESKIYYDEDYYYANGCLVGILAANRNVSLVAIAAKVTDGNYAYAAINGVGATGKMYDCLNQALLSTNKDYISNITSNADFSSWYGTSEYPVYINTETAYETLANKFETKSAQLESLKYNIVGEVNAGTIENATFDNNVTTTYKVTFDPNNGDAATTTYYKAGDVIVKPADPEKVGDNTYTYSFNGWGAVVPETCSASATYTAQYNSAFKNYTVTFKTHDGSSVLNTKTDYHYGDEITTAPDFGTTYEIAGTTYEIGSYQSAYDTVSGNMEILAASYKCAPAGKVNANFNMYGDNYGKEKADENTYINLNAHSTLGGLSVLNGELVLYRTLKNAASIDQSSAITLYYVPNDIITELYVPFYILSVDGNLDMNMRLYAGSMGTTLPVVYKDASGNTVDKANLQNETWYTAVYTLSGATATYNQKYKLTMGATGASVELYYGRPYFTLMDGVSVETFNTEIKDNLATVYAAYNGKTGEVFACDNYSVKFLTYHNGLIPVFNKNVNLSFSESIWEQYLGYQTSGGKVMTADVKFIYVDTNAISYNGEIYNGSGYGAISNAASNQFRPSNKFFIFYNSDGQSVNYQNLAINTWYKMVIDIDAIKTGVAAQNTRVWEQRNCSSIFFRSGDDAIAIGNVEFADNQIAFKTGGGGTVSSYYENDGTLVTVGTSSHQYSYRLFFADTLWNNYLDAQTVGGKVMQMDIKFDDTVSLSGYLSGSGANLNTYRANTTYFRFYDESGNAVAYADLAAGTWYRLVLDIDAIKSGIGTQGTGNGAEPNIKFARESAGTISVKNVEFTDNQIAFKSTVAGAVTSYYDNDTLITEVHYNSSGAVHTTPFSDAAWEAYLAAQDEGGKVLRFDIKFTTSATINGHALVGGSMAYLSSGGGNGYRGNPDIFRYYDAEGNSVAYTNLATSTWYRVVIDIVNIKKYLGVQDTRTFTGHTGSSFRFSANIADEIISVKNVQFVDKANENA